METLANWLWQGLLLTAFLAAVIGRVPRLSAATRYLLWWAALAAVLAIPLLREISRRTGAGDGAPAVAVPQDTRPQPLIPELPAPPAWLADTLLALWAGTVAVGGIRLVRALIHLRQLKRTSSPLTSQEQGPGAAGSPGSSRRHQAEVRISDEIETPCAAGVGRPVILLPRRLVDTLSVRDLRLVVLHEQAHLERRDDWTRLLQAILNVLAGLHPGVRWISNRIDSEREAACDELVVAATGSALAYSSCLANVAALAGKWGPQESAVALVPGIAGDGLSLESRVRRLLAGRPTIGFRAARLALLSGAALIALLTGIVLRSGLELRVGTALVAARASSGPFAAHADAPELAAVVEPSPRAQPQDRNPQAHVSGAAEKRFPEDRTKESLKETGVEIAIDADYGALSSTQGLPASHIADIPLAPRQDSPQSVSNLNLQPSRLEFLNGTLSGFEGAKVGNDWAGPWVETADRARKGGTVVAGFFSRTGRSIAGIF